MQSELSWADMLMAKLASVAGWSKSATSECQRSRKRRIDMSPEAAVRAFFDVCSSGQPERFDGVVAGDYTDCGHTPPGRGVQGARDDYEHAVKLVGGVTRYDIDALVVRGDTVAAAWTGIFRAARTIGELVS